jgi:hypothetical protein
VPAEYILFKKRNPDEIPQTLIDSILSKNKNKMLLPEDAYDRQAILLPVHVEPNHWIGCAVLHNAQLMLLFDSIRGSNNAEIVRILIELLNQVISFVLSPFPVLISVRL